MGIALPPAEFRGVRRLRSWLGQRSAGIVNALGARRGGREHRQAADVRAYLAGHRVPWSSGYEVFRAWRITETLNDPEALRRFREGLALNPGHGHGLDERAVEYPWIFARAATWGRTLLDAGGTLAVPFLNSHPAFADKFVITYDLEPQKSRDATPEHPISGDLRAIALRDGVADTIVCISTLDHIGMDNTRLYTRRRRYREDKRFDYRLAMKEFRRILKPGGRLHLTVPFGREEQHGWMQQFNEAGLKDIMRSFGEEAEETAFFRYTPDGWSRTNAEECRDAKYFDIHAGPWRPGLPAAAEAVGCVTLRAKT